MSKEIGALLAFVGCGFLALILAYAVIAIRRRTFPWGTFFAIVVGSMSMKFMAQERATKRHMQRYRIERESREKASEKLGVTLPEPWERVRG